MKISPDASYNLGIGARLLRGSFFRVLSSIIAAAISFFMMPFLVLHLGTYWYGVWASIGSLVGNYYLLDLGLSTAVTRYVTEALAKNDTDAANRVISTAFWIYCGLALVLLMMTFVMTALAALILEVGKNTQIVGIIILISGLTITIGFPFKALAGIIQSKLRYDLLSWTQLVILIAATGLTIYLISNNYGVLALAVVGLMANIASDVFFFIISKKFFPELDITWRRFSRDFVRELFSFSIWAFLINASNQIRLRIDLLVVAGIQSAVAVTHYSVGSRTAEIANEFLYQATNMVQPLVTRYHATSNHERMRSALIFLTKINIAFGVFVAGMLFILGEPFIKRWMGDDFTNSTLILYLLAAALTVGFIANPLDYTLIAILRHRFLAIVNLAGCRGKPWTEYLVRHASWVGWCGLRYADSDDYYSNFS